MYTKTKMLLGEKNIEIIKNLNICIVGIGGVGGYVAEFLSRSGVGAFTLIDFDKVENSNINRQIIALENTIGFNKAKLMAQRILEINSNAKVKIVEEKLEKNNIENIFLNQKFDYIIDCIDNVSDKIALIKFCKTKNINIVSALGAGNRFSIPEYEIKDIFKTSNDGLARVIRKKLREDNITNLDVCICKSGADINLQQPASIVWHPAVCGAVISAYVINKLIKN